MKNLFLLRHLFLYCLIMVGITCPAITSGQTITITGNTNVCVGSTEAYVPSISNAAYNYQWTVTPSTAGNVLSGNSAGANIQWNASGAATILLTVSDPQSGNSTVYTGSLDITVNPLPAPFATADLLINCQPLNTDSFRDAPPPITFDSSHCEHVCAFSTVTYTAHGSTGSSYVWSAAGALSVTPIGPLGVDCQIQWGTAGNGQVTLTETTVAGCTASTTFCVEIVESPVADFTPQPNAGDPVLICLHGQISLMDQSTGSTASPIVSWLWDWGDGSSSTTSPGVLNNPVTHQYDVPGDYEIRLTVVNSCGCSSTRSLRVTVVEPEAPVIACPRVVCEGDIEEYSVDKPCNPNSWEVVGGSILGAAPDRVQIQWDQVDPNTGFGYVMYRSCDPCPQIVSEEIPVVLSRANIQGPTAVCPGGQYVYRLPKWPATEFNWSVTGPGTLLPTDQRNEIALTATASGTITLSVNWLNTVLKCGGRATLVITVLPQAAIAGDSLICENTTGSFNLGGTLSGNWTLYTYNNIVLATGSGPNFGYNFTTPGVYRVHAEGSTFCPPPDRFVTVVATPPPPTAISGPDAACIGIPTRYDAGDPVPGTTFLWNAPGTVNAAIGDHSYINFNTIPGTITVWRVTSDAAHCQSSPISKVVIDPVPALVISGDDTVCHSTEHTYSVNYPDADLYEWSVAPQNLGSIVQDANSATPKVLWNIPNSPGQSAWLIVKLTKCGNDHLDSMQVYIKGIPTITGIALQQDTVCSGTPVVLLVSTNTPVDAGANYNVSWGDGSFSTPPPPFPTTPYPYQFSNTYNTDGSNTPELFTPAITISDINGCAGSVTATAPTVTVMPRPIAVLSPTGPIEHCGNGWTETFNATITTGIGGSNTFTWNHPPGAPAGTNNPTYPGADQFGEYSVTVTNSVFGCQSTSNPVNILLQCDTGDTGSGGMCGAVRPPVSMTADSADCGDINVTVTVPPGYSYAWTTPAEVTENSSSSTAFSGTASAAGLFTITYRVFYGSCHHDTFVNVLVPYLPDLRYDIACNQPGSNYAVTLHDHSTEYPLTPISSRQYYLLTGSTLTLIGSGLDITTTQAGGSTATYVEIINGLYGPCSDTVTVEVPQFPTVDISLAAGVPSTGCVDDVVFTFNHTVTGNVSSYLWNFGDGTANAASAGSIGRVYNTATSPFANTVSLTVTDIYGCVASDNVNVTIVGNPYTNPNVIASPNPACQGTAVSLTYIGGGGALNSYTWYQEQNPIYTTFNPTNFYQVYQPGGYWVRGVGNFGCTVNTANAVIPVDIVQVPPVSIMGDSSQCVGSTFMLTTQDYGTDYTYTWSGAGTGTGTSLSQTLNTPGTYTYYVTITHTATSCPVISAPFTVTVHNQPPTPFISYSILNCQPYELQLDASVGSGYTYNWSNGMTGPIITTPFGGPYMVTVTDANGCKSTNTNVLPKDPADYLWVFPTGCFCFGGSVSGTVIGPIIPFAYWAWLKDGSVDASGFNSYMTDYTVTPGRTYNMHLDNGVCAVTSGDMYLDADTCRRLAPRPTAGDAEAISGALGDILGDSNALQLTPNPANGQVTALYHVAKGSSGRSIQLVDMVGRVLQTYRLASDQGSVVLPLDKYAAGMYQVVLRRDGMVVQQSKLSVTK